MMDGTIDCLIIEGSYSRELFAHFIRSLVDRLQPYPEPNSVVVMDNCSIYKAAEIRDLIESKWILVMMKVYSSSTYSLQNTEAPSLSSCQLIHRIIIPLSRHSLYSRAKHAGRGKSGEKMERTTPQSRNSYIALFVLFEPSPQNSRVHFSIFPGISQLIERIEW